MTNILSTHQSDQYQVVPSSDDDDSRETEQNVLAVEPADDSVVEEEAPPRPPHPVLMLLFRVIKFIMLPFCRIFFAPAAQKTFVKTTVMVVTISWIIVTSIVAYIMFYNQYVPPITHVQPIWFHYKPLQGPKALIDIRSMVRYTAISFNAIEINQGPTCSRCDMNKCMMCLSNCTSLHQTPTLILAIS